MAKQAGRQRDEAPATVTAADAAPAGTAEPPPGRGAGRSRYRRPQGLRYREFLTALHDRSLFDWYLEIGCRTGASFAPVRGKTIAVDPFFRAETNIIGNKPVLHVFQMTSDDFFASGFLARNDIRLGLSFLDGMHLFEYLLRDFIATEAASDPKGVIMIHDCVPHRLEMTTRDLDAIRGPWTGDVWKLVPILRRWRPDLTLTMLDLRPTGVLCVSGLAPGNRTLQDSYDSIVAEFTPQDIEMFGVERFFDLFEYTDAAAMMAAGFPMFQAVARDATAAVVPRKLST